MSQIDTGVTLKQDLEFISATAVTESYAFSAADAMVIGYALGRSNIKTLFDGNSNIHQAALQAMFDYDKLGDPMGYGKSVLQSLVDLNLTSFSEDYPIEAVEPPEPEPAP